MRCDIRWRRQASASPKLEQVIGNRISLPEHDHRHPNKSGQSFQIHFCTSMTVVADKAWEKYQVRCCQNELGTPGSLTSKPPHLFQNLASAALHATTLLHSKPRQPKIIPLMCVHSIRAYTSNAATYPTHPSQQSPDIIRWYPCIDLLPLPTTTHLTCGLHRIRAN